MIIIIIDINIIIFSMKFSNIYFVCIFKFRINKLKVVMSNEVRKFSSHLFCQKLIVSYQFMNKKIGRKRERAKEVIIIILERESLHTSQSRMLNLFLFKRLWKCARWITIFDFILGFEKEIKKSNSPPFLFFFYAQTFSSFSLSLSLSLSLSIRISIKFKLKLWWWWWTLTEWPTKPWKKKQGHEFMIFMI